MVMDELTSGRPIANDIEIEFDAPTPVPFNELFFAISPAISAA